MVQYTPKLGLHRRVYHLHDVVPYINWLYFFHAWGFPPRFATIAHLHGCDACRASWLSSFSQEERPKAAEAMQLFKEAQRMLNQLDQDYHLHGVVRLMECNSRENDILLYLDEAEEPQQLPLLRQQTGEPPYLCLADFIRPASQGIRDVMGAFATTIDAEIERLYAQDDYKRLLVQTLADRLAEAAAERLHQEVRKELWGYAPDEQLTPQQLNNEEFQGIRPAVGYPSLPDQSINRLLNRWIEMPDIGIQLTENAMMRPHASVSGLMFSHPQSRYFAVGRIGADQFKDYAHRRAMTQEELRPFLLGNL